MGITIIQQPYVRPTTYIFFLILLREIFIFSPFPMQSMSMYFLITLFIIFDSAVLCWMVYDNPCAILFCNKCCKSNLLNIFSYLHKHCQHKSTSNSRINIVTCTDRSFMQDTESMFSTRDNPQFGPGRDVVLNPAKGSSLLSILLNAKQFPYPGVAYRTKFLISKTERLLQVFIKY